MNKYKCKEDVKGIIINIKHGASKEGPGWRSIVYFKGCNFYCLWCGSPESIPLNPRTRKKLVQKDNKQILDNIKKRKNPPGCALLRGVAGVLRVLYIKSKKVSIIVSKFYLTGALANNLINCQEKKFDPISPSQITFLFLVEIWVSV